MMRTLQFHFAILILLLSVQTVAGFVSQTKIGSTEIIKAPLMAKYQTLSSSSLCAKATKKKKGSKKKAGGAAAGIKGFGAVSAPSSGNHVETDRSAEARAFYDYLEKQQAGDNLKRCALGYFPLPNGVSLRGVVAMRDLQKGDVIIRIPYEVAVNLGQEGGDPTLPAVEFLRDYCEVLGPNGEAAANRQRKPYYEMLPPFRGDDCLGSTDFFSDEALEALQSPTVMEETLRRRERTKRRFEQDIDDNFASWIDGSTVTQEHLQWAVWLITSRVLTVQGDAEEGKSYRLLIPFLDMCNHDRKSSHVLSGRAVPGGELKVVAGSAVKAGEQINICYGGGVAGNDRFLQDYGFLDSDKEAYEMVAQQLLGKRRLLEGANAGKTMLSADREEALKILRSTKMEEDAGILDSSADQAVKSAIEYRLGVKTALSKQIVMQ